MSPALARLNAAVLAVEAGHGDVDALAAGAPVLATAARMLHESAKGSKPCHQRLLKARRLVLRATRDLSGAARKLGVLVVALRKQQPSSAESDFLILYGQGSFEFQEALASLRQAGVPLVRATDGKGIFEEAGCGDCHTLAATGASGTVGPNLDDAKPSKALVVRKLTGEVGVMSSFKGKLSGAQIQAVADYVSQNAGPSR
jgi:mono/diheme cytochrome c family protein